MRDHERYHTQNKIIDKFLLLGKVAHSQSKFLLLTTYQNLLALHGNQEEYHKQKNESL